MNKLKFLQHENNSNLKMKSNLMMTKMKFDMEIGEKKLSTQFPNQILNLL